MCSGHGLQVLEQPLLNVTALPQEDDLFTWHGNVRGDPDSPFTDVPFHFLLSFPDDYPLNPPKVGSRSPVCFQQVGVCVHLSLGIGGWVVLLPSVLRSTA